jgi:hypothetical protein
MIRWIVVAVAFGCQVAVAQAGVLGADVLDMQFPHWLMIGGALLVFIGLVGAALQRKRAQPISQPWSKMS